MSLLSQKAPPVLHLMHKRQINLRKSIVEDCGIPPHEITQLRYAVSAKGKTRKMIKHVDDEGGLLSVGSILSVQQMHWKICCIAGISSRFC